MARGRPSMPKNSTPMAVKSVTTPMRSSAVCHQGWVRAKRVIPSTGPTRHQDFVIAFRRATVFRGNRSACASMLPRPLCNNPSISDTDELKGRGRT
jgi:hypothetical protein